MNARLRIAYSNKNKVSPAQQTQLFQIPLDRRKQYKLKSNERWLESVEAARRNKKRHEEKQAKRDRNIRLFFRCNSEKDCKKDSIHSTTASPYSRPNHRQTTLLVKSNPKIANIAKNHSPSLPPAPTYAGIPTVESRRKAFRTSETIRERAIRLHEIIKITHRKTRNSRIWDHFKAKAA